MNTPRTPSAPDQATGRVTYSDDVVDVIGTLDALRADDTRPGKPSWAGGPYAAIAWGRELVTR